MPPVTVKWYEGTMKPPRPAELEADRELSDSGHVIIGEKGTIYDSTNHLQQPAPHPRSQDAKDAPPAAAQIHSACHPVQFRH